MDSKIFKSQERTQFFQNSGLPFWDAYYQIGENKKVFYSYALYMCRKEDPKLIRQIQIATVAVAEVFDKVLKSIKKWKEEDLERWGFSKEYYSFYKVNWDDIFCFRAGWGIENGNLKLLEINSQTPSFWFEPEQGNKLLAQHFVLADPTPGSDKYLAFALNQSIAQSLKRLPTIPKDPRIGFVTCDYYEDLEIMKWLSQYCDFKFDIMKIDQLDFRKSNDVPFNNDTKKDLDCIIFWHPIEWLPEMKFTNGESFFKVFISSLEKQRFALPHAISAFFIQPKTILAYITKNKRKIFTGKLKSAEKYFLRTYYKENPFKTNYIAKPVWGREGRGAYIDNGQIVRSRYQEYYYVKQEKVFQELVTLPKIPVGNYNVTAIYESWVYKVGKWYVPGAVGLRGSEHLITDDFSYWIPIGV